MITDELPGRNECWGCDRKVYSIIFWNELVGLVQLSKFSKSDTKWFIQKVQEFNPDPKELEKEKCKMGAPTMYGEFTNWKPKKMREIREYCDKINTDKPNIFEICKDKDLIQPQFTTVEDLPEEQLLKYEMEVKHYYESYKKIWKEIIFKYLKYQKPNLVNVNDYTTRTDYPLYVFPCVMNMGKQYYMVR